jgi:hypothetical protein
MDLVEVSRWQSIYRTEVATRTDEAAFGEYWQHRLEQLQGRQPRPVELEPDVRGVWYRTNPASPDLLTLEAVRPAPGGYLVVSGEADAGREAPGETLARIIANAFVPETSQGFCVGTGAIRGETSGNEQVRLVLALEGEPALEVRFSTRTVREPDTMTYSDLDEERQLAAAQGAKLVELRNKRRKAAGLAGREIRISVTEATGEGMLRFTWHHPGVGGEATSPAIDIVGSAPLLLKDRLEFAWDVLLSSLEPIPTGQR